ncbi:hypothetical protein [Saccharopolyspora sp. NPDC049426]|uniref:hypothetical protein n=1 Tax=Saccharopolyspora sp. NPDC049426 TaxID=3155652 RepID=UPI00341D9376
MRKSPEARSTAIEEPLEGERAALATDRIAVKLELDVLDAETAVLESEALGITDVVAMRRLDRARSELRKFLARRQWARALSAAPASIDGGAAA